MNNFSFDGQSNQSIESKKYITKGLKRKRKNNLTHEYLSSLYF